jgi:hypothetical protein
VHVAICTTSGETKRNCGITADPDGSEPGAVSAHTEYLLHGNGTSRWLGNANWSVCVAAFTLQLLTAWTGLRSVSTHTHFCGFVKTRKCIIIFAGTHYWASTFSQFIPSHNHTHSVPLCMLVHLPRSLFIPPSRISPVRSTYPALVNPLRITKLAIMRFSPPWSYPLLCPSILSILCFTYLLHGAESFLRS